MRDWRWLAFGAFCLLITAGSVIAQALTAYRESQPREWVDRA